MNNLEKPSSVLFKESGIIPIHQRILYHKSLLVYKSISGLAPDYMSDLLIQANDSNVYNTRFSSQNNLIVQRPKTETFKSSFSFSGPKLWNSLSSEIKNCKNVFDFKRLYKSTYFER